MATEIRYTLDEILSYKTMSIPLPSAYKAAIESVKASLPAASTRATTHGGSRWKTSGPPPSRAAYRQHTVAQATEDADETINEKRLRQIQGKINRLDAGTYAHVKDWLYLNFEATDEKMVRQTCELIFSKAVREELFSPVFAQLLHDLSAKFITMRGIVSEKVLEFPEILKIASGTVDDAEKEREKFIKINEEKRFKRGYALFLGELYNQAIISRDQLTTMFTLLIDSTLVVVAAGEIAAFEEYIDCISRIFKGTRGHIVEIDKCTDGMKELNVVLIDASDKYGIKTTSKAYFTLLDLMDTYAKAVSFAEVRDILRDLVAQIVSNHGSDKSRAELDRTVSDILDCIADASDDFITDVMEYLMQLKVVIEKPPTATPGLSSKARAALLSIVKTKCR